MSVKEKIGYLKGMEYDYNGDAEAVKEEILLNLDAANDTAELEEWKNAIFQRLEYTRNLARVYDDACAVADSRWFTS